MAAVSAPWTDNGSWDTGRFQGACQASAEAGCSSAQKEAISLTQSTPSPSGDSASATSSLLSCSSCLPESPGEAYLHHEQADGDGRDVHTVRALCSAPGAAGELCTLLRDLLAREEEDEASKQPAAAAADGTPRLTGAERANLVNWMASAAASLGLADDVLFSAVSCLDTLTLPQGAADALVSAAACLWIAAKWTLGARAPPASAVVSALPACACGACASCTSGRAGAAAAAVAARRHLLHAESRVLRTLSFGSSALRRPTVESFVHTALLQLRQQQAPARGAPRVPIAAAAPVCWLLAEESLLESQLLAMRPSAVAAGCIAYAHALLGAPLTEAELTAATGVSAATASRAAGVLRAVHAAVAAAAGAGNPYATSLRWAARAPAAVRVAPIECAGDPRLLPFGAGLAGGAWLWVLPAPSAGMGRACGAA